MNKVLLQGFLLFTVLAAGPGTAQAQDQILDGIGETGMIARYVFNGDTKDLGKSIKGDPTKLEFMIDDVVFKPFCDTYGRHSVYLDVRLK
ncbi:hypothetical protein [Leadbetterella sp. DM7]|uniref:hypothetical protein n=1 Tax=Leadbetterella sp. DM7 TaxID=3235085 RepID=UPI00349EA876